MSFYPGHGVGLRNVGSYQISGHPYITGSTLALGEEKHVAFPFVTRDFTVINSGSGVGPQLRIHFNSTSSGNVASGKHYLDLSQDDASFTFNHKCTGVYITCVSGSGNDFGYTVIANLTGIDTNHMYELTGAGLTD
jgi:hypothetical protein